MTTYTVPLRVDSERELDRIDSYIAKNGLDEGDDGFNTDSVHRYIKYLEGRVFSLQRSIDIPNSNY